MARCNKCRSGLARDAPRGRRSISKALKISRQALREAPRGRRSISKALKISKQALRDAPRAALGLMNNKSTTASARPTPPAARVKAPAHLLG